VLVPGPDQTIKIGKKTQFSQHTDNFEAICGSLYMYRFDISRNLQQTSLLSKDTINILLSYLEYVEQSLLCYRVEAVWASAMVAQPNVVTDSFHVQVSELLGGRRSIQSRPTLWTPKNRYFALVSIRNRDITVNSWLRDA